MKKVSSPVLLVGTLVLVACTLHASEAAPSNVGDRCQGCGGSKVCCDWGSGYACCPYDDGVCCGGYGDYGSCCPSGTRCPPPGSSTCLSDYDHHLAHEANLTLLKYPMPVVQQAAIIPAVERAYVLEAAPSNVEVQAGPNCPNGARCSSGKTCCQNKDIYMCCPYNDGVCCHSIGNTLTCCPKGYSCGGVFDDCKRIDRFQPALEVKKILLEAAMPAEQSTLTTSGNNEPTLGARMTFSLNATVTILKRKIGASATKCPNANCPGEDGGSICCPFDSGVCCKHSAVGCCPKDWTCTDDFILGCKWW